MGAPPGSDYFGELLFMAHPLPPGGRGNGDPGRYLGELPALEGYMVRTFGSGVTKVDEVICNHGFIFAAGGAGHASWGSGR